MKGFIKNTIIGILIGILSLVFTDWYGAVITGFIAALILNVVFVAQVWVRELFRQKRYRTITIWKGFHRPFPWFLFWPFLISEKGFELHKVVKFTKDSVYDNSDGKYTKNKLFGFFVGHPHKNSARWAWDIDTEGRIKLHTYSYNQGKRYSCMSIPVTLDTDYHLFITYQKGVIKYKCLGYEKKENINMPRIAIGWMLGNYFGGKLKAGQTIKYLTYS